MNNDNVKTVKEKVIENQASRIMEKLQADQDSKMWYWKICWHLSESQIQDNLSTALKGKNPQKYFTWLCKRDMLQE